MRTIIGIYQISIPKDADRDAFEKFVEMEVFPKVAVGKGTRGGIVTAQYFLKLELPGYERDYSWIVRWVDLPSRFGSTGAPPDPAAQLEAFGAKTSFAKFRVVAEENNEKALV